MRRIHCSTLVLAGSIVFSGCLHAPIPWSPDGKWIAYTVEVRAIEKVLCAGWLFDTVTTPLTSVAGSNPPTSYRLWATRKDSGASVLLEESNSPLTAPGWSPDGRALAFGRLVVPAEGPARFEVVILEGPTRRRVVSSSPLPEVNAEVGRLPGQAIAWSPDGRLLAVPQLHPLGLAIIRADNGRQINAINDAFLPSWSPDGSRLAFFLRGTGDTLNCIDSPTGSPRMLHEVGQGSQAPSWTRDGLSVLVVARRSVPKGGEPPGEQAELIRLRIDTGKSEMVRSLATEAVLGRDRTVDGVSIAFDGEKLLCSTVVEGSPHIITWYHPRENEVFKKFALLDYTAPMGSLSISPDGSTLAARIGSIDHLGAPALCDLESSDLRTRLIAPDDSARIEWIATLVTTARTILASLPVVSPDAKSPSSNRLDRPTLLPIVGEFESNSETIFRLGRIGRLGRPLCDRPPGSPPCEPRVAALLDEARLFFDYLAGNYPAALEALEILEARVETPERRANLLGVRAQILLAQGQVDRASDTIAFLRSLSRQPARQVEWVGSGYVVSVAGLTTGKGQEWLDYLTLRASKIREQLHEDEAGGHVNPDNNRADIVFNPFALRANPPFPDRPFFNDPRPPQDQGNRPGMFLRPRMPTR